VKAPLRVSRIELQFAEVKDPVKDKLKRFGLPDQIGTDASIRPSAPQLMLTSQSTPWTGNPEFAVGGWLPKDQSVNECGDKFPKF
jgi:hypothetical protein